MDGPPLRAWGTRVVDLGHRSYRAWRRDRVLRLGAGLAYYALFGLVPFVVLAVTLAGAFVSSAQLQTSVADVIADALALDPSVVSARLSQAVDDIDAADTVGVGLVGLGSLLFSATLVFVALQDALDVIWHVPVQTGLQPSVRRRATAFGVILLGAGLLVAVTAVQSALGVVTSLLPGGRPVVDALTGTVVTGAVWALVAGVMSTLLRVLPRPDVRWRAAAVGGVLTTVVLIVGTWGFSLYLRTVAVGSASGAASGVIAVLLYSYFASQVVLGGAVVTCQLDTAGPPAP